MKLPLHEAWIMMKKRVIFFDNSYDCALIFIKFTVKCAKISACTGKIIHHILCNIRDRIL